MSDRFCLILKVPMLSDEAALQLSEVLQQLAEQLDAAITSRSCALTVHGRSITTDCIASSACSRPSSRFPSTTTTMSVERSFDRRWRVSSRLQFRM